MKMNKKYKIIIIIAILLFIYSIFSMLLNNREEKILYRKLVETLINNQIEIYYQYEIMNLKNNKINILGKYNGTPAISNNQKFIAINCSDNYMQLCILKKSNFSNQYFEKLRINLPNECEGLVSKDYGLESISWNKDNEKIAFVCGISPKIHSNFQGVVTNRQICILLLKDKSYNCFENNEIYSAVWSPNENKMLLSPMLNLIDEKILLYDPENNTNQELISGYSPNWSPDGDKIVYESNLNEISIYNINSKENELIYKNNSNDQKYNIYFTIDPYFYWTKNNKIIFNGGVNFRFRYDIIQLNIETKEINCITCKIPEPHHIIHPTWGK